MCPDWHFNRRHSGLLGARLLCQEFLLEGLGTCRGANMQKKSTWSRHCQHTEKLQRVRTCATIHSSPFKCCFCRFFLCVRSQVCSATRTPNSHNHSYVHYSLSKFTGEWFTNHANRIHIFTPITRIVATKVRTSQQSSKMLRPFLEISFCNPDCLVRGPNSWIAP